MYKLIILTIFVTLTGCKTLDAVISSTIPGKVSVQESGDYKVVTMTGNVLIKEEGDLSVNKIKVAATWENSNPNIVKLRFLKSQGANDDDTSFFNFTGSQEQQKVVEQEQAKAANVIMTSIQIKTEDKELNFYNKDKGFNGAGGIIHDSEQLRNVIELSMSDLETMINAKVCTIKLKAVSFNEDSLFSLDKSGSGAVIARGTLKEFLHTVKSS